LNIIMSENISSDIKMKIKELEEKA
jgi:hypothetical protein